MPDQRGMEINADLECEIDGHSVRIRSNGDGRIRCTLPDVKALFDVRRVLRGRISLLTLGQSFSLIEQTLEVHVAGNTIARFGKDVDGRLLGLFGLGASEIRFGRIALLALKRSM